MYDSIILNTDSYKMSHFLQYPPRTQTVHSYIESRGGKFPSTLFFGLQIFLKEYLTKPVTLADIDFAEEVVKAHGLPFNRAGWEYIVNQHKGILPLRIRAVPEGTLVPTHNVLVSVENTDDQVPWLTSFVETALLRGVWYPTTVATVSYNIKRLIKRFLEETGDPNLLPFKLHDFGARGVSSAESAGIGGAAHLVNFMGTDTFAGLMVARKYYNCPMAGFSIPAAEHSTITSWGQEHEKEAYANMVDQFAGPERLYAVVSDSYDIDNAVDHIWGESLKEKVLKAGGTLIVRPDSGDPATVCLKVVQSLGKHFGWKLNVKGYKVLNPAVRLIQGDGINQASIHEILQVFKSEGWSADNIAFGMGGALLQHMNRDTLKFAMKASAIEVDYHYRDVFKNPKTDPGKASKRGIQALFINKETSEYRTFNVTRGDPDTAQWKYAMRIVYDDGVKVDETFDTIRKRANEQETSTHRDVDPRKSD